MSPGFYWVKPTSRDPWQPAEFNGVTWWLIEWKCEVTDIFQIGEQIPVPEEYELSATQ